MEARLTAPAHLQDGEVSCSSQPVCDGPRPHFTLFFYSANSLNHPPSSSPLPSLASSPFSSSLHFTTRTHSVYSYAYSEWLSPSSLSAPVAPPGKHRLGLGGEGGAIAAMTSLPFHGPVLRGHKCGSARGWSHPLGSYTIKPHCHCFAMISLTLFGTQKWLFFPTTGNSFSLLFESLSVVIYSFLRRLKTFYCRLHLI